MPNIVKSPTKKFIAVYLMDDGEFLNNNEFQQDIAKFNPRKSMKVEGGSLFLFPFDLTGTDKNELIDIICRIDQTTGFSFIHPFEMDDIKKWRKGQWAPYEILKNN